MMFPVKSAVTDNSSEGKIELLLSKLRFDTLPLRQNLL